MTHRTSALIAACLFVLIAAVADGTPTSPRALLGAAAKWTLGGVPTRLIEVPSAAPFGTAECPGVRPGAVVETDVGLCTLNFVFNGSDGNRYIGTAGHCILGDSPIGGDVGETSWDPGEGPIARDSAGNRIGEFAYAILLDPKDFSLIRLDPGVSVNSQMCHFGGPSGINADTPSDLVVLQHFGNGLVIGDVLPARTAFTIGMPSPDHVFAQGLALPGDSGSGVTSSDGRAVGVLVTVGIHTAGVGTDGVDAGVVGITRIAPQVARAGAVLGTGLSLATAPTL